MSNIVVINADGKTLGRLASYTASLILGKRNSHCSPNRVFPIRVEIINAALIHVSGEKRLTKKYKRYSGYPGGLKEIPFNKIFKKDPKIILRRAIGGMLPMNKLWKKRMRNVIIYAYEKDK